MPGASAQLETRGVQTAASGEDASSSPPTDTQIFDHFELRPFPPWGLERCTVPYGGSARPYPRYNELTELTEISNTTNSKEQEDLRRPADLGDTGPKNLTTTIIPGKFRKRHIGTRVLVDPILGFTMCVNKIKNEMFII